MRTVTIEKEGNNYTVNPNASPSGGDALYAWYDSASNVRGFSITENVAIGDKLLSKDAPLYDTSQLENYWFTVTAVGEGTVTVIIPGGDEYVLTRDSEHDISF